MLSGKGSNFPFPENSLDRSERAQEEGIAYLAVLILVLILTLMGLAFLKSAEIRTHQREEALRWEQSRLCAEAALEKVSWALRRLPLLTSDDSSDLNPFSDRWCGHEFSCNSDDSLALLINPQPGEKFHPVAYGPYYRIADIRAIGTKVGVRAIGAVDTDGDGLDGIFDRNGDGKIDFRDADPEDTNFFLEALVGLPGSLGKDLIVAAKSIQDSQGGEIALDTSGDALWLSKAIGAAGFHYAFPEMNNYGIVLVGNISLGKPQLPRWLFDEEGMPREAYFHGIPMKRLQGPVVLEKNDDPTWDIPKGGILWVEGDVIVEKLDLEEDWFRKDVVIVAEGKATLREVKCGWKGRMVVLAPSVHVEGRPGDWLNAVLVAAKSVTLGSSEESRVVCSGSAPCHGIYLFGTILAGENLILASPGWALIFDPFVVNGSMGWRRPETSVLDRFEGSGLGTWWNGSGAELAQGVYLQDEIQNGAGDSGDLGGDSQPQVIRFTIKPNLHSPIPEGLLLLDLKNCQGCLRDWTPYSEIHFQMAMDTYQREETVSNEVLVTRRGAKLKLSLKDEEGKELYHFVASLDGTCSEGDEDKYCSNLWGKRSYLFQAGDVSDPDPLMDDYGEGVLPRWKKLKVKFRSMKEDPGAFDFHRVSELFFRIEDWKILWEKGGHARMIKPEGTTIRFYFPEVCPSGCQVTEGTGGTLQWEHPVHGALNVPCVSPEDCWGVSPLREDDLSITLRLDRIELPGAPPKPMNYGFPVAFSPEHHLWRELGEKQAGF